MWLTETNNRQKPQFFLRQVYVGMWLPLAVGSSSKASLKTTVEFAGKLSRVKRNEKGCMPGASITDTAIVVSMDEVSFQCIS